VSPDATPLRVLLVDDEKNIRTTLGLCLESLGCRVSAAATAESALASLQRQPCELCFLDLRLPATGPVCQNESNQNRVSRARGDARGRDGPRSRGAARPSSA